MRPSLWIWYWQRSRKLYRIEARAKTEAMSLEARLELRQRKPSRSSWMWANSIATMRKDVLPKSPLGKALGYAENQCPRWLDTWKSLKPSWTINSIEHTLRAWSWDGAIGCTSARRRAEKKAANLFLCS